MCMRDLDLYNTPIAAQVAVHMVAGCLDGCTYAVQMHFTVQAQQVTKILLLLLDKNVEFSESEKKYITTNIYKYIK